MQQLLQTRHARLDFHNPLDSNILYFEHSNVSNKVLVQRKRP